MGKTKTSTRNPKQKSKSKQMANSRSSQTPEHLYATALQLVEQSQPEEALTVAKQLWSQVQTRPVSEALPAVNLLGEISIELGAVDSAREYFEEAVRLDPNGEVSEAAGGGAEKFLWLAQLCEQGGKESVAWFEKGAKALQHEIVGLESGHVPELDAEQLLLSRVEKKRKLANALCGIVEVYMTDLSWEDDAETRCENLIMEAMAVEDETSPEVLQTLASVRLSQQRIEDARSALQRSLATWVDLEPEDPAVPDFATKISLARLLMEALMEGEAMHVLDRLIQEDDQSVEAWYLGGWCQHLIAERKSSATDANANSDDSTMNTDAGDGGNSATHDLGTKRALTGSRKWLKTSLNLYNQQEYEDDRLFDHAKQLVKELDAVLGPEDEQADGGESGEDEWDGIEDDDEEEANKEDEDEDMDL